MDGSTSHTVSRARALAPLVREAAEEADRERRLPERVARAFAEAGLYRLAVPASLGGAELDPLSQIETIEAVSMADGSAGWNLMIGVENLGFLGPALPLATAQKIFADPMLIVAGALNPLGRAIPVDNGYRVSGQWPFASGCQNASHFWGQCIVYDQDQPAKGPGDSMLMREALMPLDDLEIVDTWHVTGMRGSGSHDVSANEVFVPAAFSTSALLTPPRDPGPLYRFPPLNRLAYNKVGVSLGIARAALDHFSELAAQTRRRGSSKALRDKVSVQLAFAESEALFSGARAFVMEAISDLWKTVVAGRTPERPQRARGHLACAHAVATCVRVVEILHASAGSAANFTAHPLDRCLRDVRVVPQHIMVSDGWKESAGAALLGLARETPFG